MKRMTPFLTLVLLLSMAGCGDDGVSPVDSPVNGDWVSEEFESGNVTYVLEMDLVLQDDGSFRGDGQITATDPDGTATLAMTIPRGEWDPPQVGVVLEFVETGYSALTVLADFDGVATLEGIVQGGGFEGTPIVFHRP